VVVAIGLEGELRSMVNFPMKRPVEEQTKWQGQETEYPHIQRFYEYVLLENYIDFLVAVQVGSVSAWNVPRKAWNTATSMYHMREHFKPKKTDREICVECLDYKYIRDIANTYKHGSATKKYDYDSDLSEIGYDQILSCKDGEKYITYKVQTRSGSLNVNEVFESAFTYWTKQMSQLLRKKLDPLEIIRRRHAQRTR
jgi:hypothetical protein